MTDLTDDDRLAISAVVHQNYYMPDVFAVVERIVSDAARAAERALVERVEALLIPCYVTRNVTMSCTDWIGAEFGNGVWLEAMCCLPCRVRRALNPKPITTEQVSDYRDCSICLANMRDKTSRYCPEHSVSRHCSRSTHPEGKHWCTPDLDRAALRPEAATTERRWDECLHGVTLGSVCLDCPSKWASIPARPAATTEGMVCFICRRPEQEHRDRNGHSFSPAAAVHPDTEGER